MKEMRILDEVSLKQEFKDMHKELGHEACYQVLYEFIKAAELLAEVMVENEQKAE